MAFKPYASAKAVNLILATVIGVFGSSSTTANWPPTMG